MHNAVFLLAFWPCVGYGRRTQISSAHSRNRPEHIGAIDSLLSSRMPEEKGQSKIQRQQSKDAQFTSLKVFAKLLKLVDQQAAFSSTGLRFPTCKTNLDAAKLQAVSDAAGLRASSTRGKLTPRSMLEQLVMCLDIGESDEFMWEEHPEYHDDKIELEVENATDELIDRDFFQPVRDQIAARYAEAEKEKEWYANFNEHYHRHDNDPEWILNNWDKERFEANGYTDFDWEKFPHYKPSDWQSGDDVMLQYRTPQPMRLSPDYQGVGKFVTHSFEEPPPKREFVSIGLFGERKNPVPALFDHYRYWLDLGFEDVADALWIVPELGFQLNDFKYGGRTFSEQEKMAEEEEEYRKYKAQYKIEWLQDRKERREARTLRIQEALAQVEEIDNQLDRLDEIEKKQKEAERAAARGEPIPTQDSSAAEEKEKQSMVAAVEEAAKEEPQDLRVVKMTENELLQQDWFSDGQERRLVPLFKNRPLTKKDHHIELRIALDMSTDELDDHWEKLEPVFEAWNASDPWVGPRDPPNWRTWAEQQEIFNAQKPHEREERAREKVRNEAESTMYNQSYIAETLQSGSMAMWDTPADIYFGHINILHAWNWNDIRRWAEAEPIATRGGYSEHIMYEWPRSDEKSLTIDKYEEMREVSTAYEDGFENPQVIWEALPNPPSESMYAIYGVDRARASKLREAGREEHLDWLRASGRVYRAGPLLPLPAADGKEKANTAKPVGMLNIVWGQDEDEVRKWMADDPYVKAKLFESLSVHKLGGRFAVNDAIKRIYDEEERLSNKTWEYKFGTYEHPYKVGTLADEYYGGIVDHDGEWYLKLAAGEVGNSR